LTFNPAISPVPEKLTVERERANIHTRSDEFAEYVSFFRGGLYFEIGNVRHDDSDLELRFGLSYYDVPDHMPMRSVESVCDAKYRSERFHGFVICSSQSGKCFVIWSGPPLPMESCCQRDDFDLMTKKPGQRSFAYQPLSVPMVFLRIDNIPNVVEQRCVLQPLPDRSRSQRFCVYTVCGNQLPV